jgi:galactonate dehydratase
MKSMKIKSVETFLGQGGVTECLVFCKITTDDGIVGWGEGSRHHGQVVAEAIRTDLARLVIGENPFNIERIYHKMFFSQAFTDTGGGVYLSAISAIETALWDIVGKALDTPVYNLLGGKCYDRVRLYPHCNGAQLVPVDDVKKGIDMTQDMEDAARRAKDIVQKGFTALKTFQWGKYRPGRRMNGMIDEEDVRNTVEKVRVIRDTVGPDVGIAFDVHGFLNKTSAVKLGKALAPYNLMWFEEPVGGNASSLNAEAVLAVKQETGLPICMSERLYTTHGFRRLLELNAIDILQTDVAWVGGVIQSKKVAAMGESYYLPITYHDCNSALSLVMHGHLAVSTPNFMILEYNDPPLPWRDQIVSEPLRVKDGYLEVNDKPGWGVDINEAELAKHLYTTAYDSPYFKRLVDTDMFSFEKDKRYGMRL